MQKQELLKKIDNELLEKLYGFCYARTNLLSGKLREMSMQIFPISAEGIRIYFMKEIPMNCYLMLNRSTND